jgi:hypothetical protein
MAKAEKRIVTSVLRRHARESLEISLVELEGLPPMFELRRLFVPLTGEPRPMERDGTALSVAVRHLPELARAFMGAAQRAAELGMLPADLSEVAKLGDRPKGRRRAA